MASGKQLLNVITKLLDEGKKAEARSLIEADRLANAPVLPTEKTNPERAAEMMAKQLQERKAEAAYDLKQEKFPSAALQDIARKTKQAEEAQQYRGMSSTDISDADELLERLLNIRSVGGEQLDLPLRQPWETADDAPKKLTRTQEAEKRFERQQELDSSVDARGNPVENPAYGGMTGKAPSSIEKEFNQLMNERTLTSEDTLQRPLTRTKSEKGSKSIWDEEKDEWRQPTKKELDEMESKLDPFDKGIKRAESVPDRPIEEEFTELNRPAVFRDQAEQEQIVRQFGGPRAVFEDPIDEIRLNDLMRRQEYLDRQAGIPVETPTKGTPVPQSDKIDYNPRTGRIRGTPRPARKYHAELDTPSVFRAVGTGGRGGALPTRATTRTGDLESQGVGASRAGSDPIQQQHISAQELTMDSPQAQGQMLDLFGEKQDELLNRMRELIRQLPEEESGFSTIKKRLPRGEGVMSGPKKIWDPNRVKRLINIVARSKSVDELAGQLHGRKAKGAKIRDLVDETGFTPVSIDNLRATLLQAPPSPEREAALKNLNAWSKEISDLSKGRFKKQLPAKGIKSKEELGDPRPDLLEEWDRLTAPINPQDKAEAYVESLRKLYRTARGDFPPKNPEDIKRRNTDQSKLLKGIEAAGKRVAPPMDQSMIDMLRELLGQ